MQQPPDGHPRTERTRRRVAFLAVATGLGLGVAAALGAAPASKPDSVPHVVSIKDSPGWHYIVDPESTADVVGRRTNAPLVSKPFKGGTRSMNELGLAVCRMLHHSDRDSLMSLCITDEEFRDILWREFPQSRPITGLTWEDAWISLDQRLKSGVSGAIGDRKGENWTFVRIQSDSLFKYKNFTLHMRVTLVAIGDSGREVKMTWLRTIAERKGRFKIYATDD